MALKVPVIIITVPTVTITEAPEAATTSSSPTIISLKGVIRLCLLSSLTIGIAIAVLLLFLNTMETAIHEPTDFNIAACFIVGWILVEIVVAMVKWILETRRKAKESEEIEKWDAYLETGRLEVV